MDIHQEDNHQTRERLPRSRPDARPVNPPVLITLLVLAFAAGLIVARLPILSTFLSPVPSGPSPIPPTALPPSPTPPPTPTPTSPDGDTLETLYIDILPDDFDQIVAKRREALELGILLATDQDFVPATIRFRQEEIPVELRLKGDWSDHYAYDKWSFRVETEGEHALLGMHTFSLQDPSTRSYLNEWAFLENLRREDVLAVRYHFVHVVLNGEHKGIYALEEAFARELFESQGRREGLIIRYEEDLLWEYRAFYDDQTMAPGVERFYVIDDFETARIAEDPILSAQRDAAIGLLRGVWTGERAAASVFDVEQMGTFLALTDLWNAEHALIWHNLRYYYNPITARLEPVVFDSQALPDYLDPDIVGLPEDAFYEDPQVRAAYVRALRRFIQPEYVDALEAELGPQFAALQAALATEFNEKHLEAPWDTLRRRQELLRQMLTPYQMVYAYIENPPSTSSEVLDLQVGNLVDLPVEVVGLEVGGEVFPASGSWVAADSAHRVVPPAATDGDALILRALPDEATSMPYVHLQVPDLPPTATVEASSPILMTRLWGLTRVHTTTILPGYPAPLEQGPLPEFPTVAQTLEQHPILERVSGEDTLRIPRGDWEITGDLILPQGFGLRLAPGTTLRFGAESILLATGPLDFQGTAEDPIVLRPSADTWQGVVVLQAGAPSRWEHVTVEAASFVDRDGWILTGGITFYESPIQLENCHILHSRGEDGINVVRTEFGFVASEFAHTASDAFDADFASGIIEGCSFHDIGGDGIDVSGSEVEVYAVRMLDVGDKGISVGEASRLTAVDISVENVGFGLVSKDLSHATLSDATITAARVAGLAAYIKKPAYGPASVVATDVTFTDMPSERQTLVQTGSWIELEGERIYGTEVDVDALYDDEG
ncbi:MAG: CotH kinase family protein [Anaerolineae bacterium]|jgi:hypothetical protein